MGAEEDSKIKGVRKTIDSHVRVLKIFEEYKAYFILSELDLPGVLAEFKEKFDKWIKDVHITIKTGHLTIEKIFEDYFKIILLLALEKRKQSFRMHSVS